MRRSGGWKQAAEGAGYLHAGIRAFYRDPGLWGYALIPMGILFAFYALMMLLLFWFAAPWAAGLLPDPAQWSAWFRWLLYAARVLIYVSVFGMAVLTGAFFLCSLYEAFGAFFFDSLVQKFERERYGVEAAPVPFRENLRYLLQSAGFSFVTMIWSFLLFWPGIFIPVAGILPGCWWSATVSGSRTFSPVRLRTVLTCARSGVWRPGTGRSCSASARPATSGF